MAQPSVAQYFNTRKRSAIDDCKINSARKVLILDGEKLGKTSTNDGPKPSNREIIKIPTKITNVESQQIPKKKSVRVTKTTKIKQPKQENGQSIQTFITNMKSVPERCTTPPNPIEKPVDKDLINIKKKLLKSSRLNELRQSIKNFKNSAEQLKAAEKKTNEVSSHSPKLKSFQSIEFEVPISPQKVQSPEKPYLSPKKEPSVRKNLLTILSPTKHSLSSETYQKDATIDTKQGLKLPYKYRTLAEIFRAVDTISQILYNRKEIITLKKLKSAVEEMLKRNLNEKHLAQIKSIYPNAYEYRQEKIRQFGTREEEWNLVLIPNINNAESMTSEIILNRRRKLFEILIKIVKDYHEEFLLSLTPPMVIDKDKITRWHPEFDLEKVPEIDSAELPKPPEEEKLTTGKEVLEKARLMFNCNTRMEQALAKLKAKKELEGKSEITVTTNESILKGIPKALLDRVRQKQAAKALMSMTRSVDQDKEIQMYLRLSEIARLTRNLFVSEKKGVLPLETVIDKLGNSYRCTLSKIELEDHLKAIAKEVPEWLIFHNIRNSVYLKLAKNADVSKVLNKLEKIAKAKNEN